MAGRVKGTEFTVVSTVSLNLNCKISHASHSALYTAITSVGERGRKHLGKR